MEHGCGILQLFATNCDSLLARGNLQQVATVCDHLTARTHTKGQQ
jgi:hypothetical protein